MNSTASCADAPSATSTRRNLRLIAVLLALGMTSLSSCAFIKRHTVGEDDPDAAPKRREPNYRDAVEQKVFYDGWFQR